MPLLMLKNFVNSVLIGAAQVGIVNAFDKMLE
jgi:hypothetical protein